LGKETRTSTFAGRFALPNTRGKVGRRKGKRYLAGGAKSRLYRRKGRSLYLFAHGELEVRRKDGLSSNWGRTPMTQHS